METLVNLVLMRTLECEPVDDYGQIKLMSEKLVNAILETTSSLDLPSVYGDGNNKGVIYHWQNSIAAGETLKVGDNGLSYRSFLHINDLVSIFHLSITIDIIQVSTIYQKIRVFL